MNQTKSIGFSHISIQSHFRVVLPGEEDTTVTLMISTLDRIIPDSNFILTLFFSTGIGLQNSYTYSVHSNSIQIAFILKT